MQHIENSTINSALFTDFYELTMAQGYWKNGMNENSVFDVFFRRQPYDGGFAVFAGVQTLLNALTTFTFTDEDIAYLDTLGLFEKGFLDYLSTFHFSGDMWTIAEGSVVFPQEPLARIHANLIEAQIIEGLVLNHLNFQSLIATKTARVWLASNHGHIMEFGLRRAQGPDGAMSASRAAYIGGATGTSNTLAGKLYGIPVQGTMAHSWIMSFDTELEAFRAYAKIYPKNSVFLIDTYNTLEQGIRNAIIAGKELVAQGYSFGVRLDSGDMSYLTAQCRKILDEAGLPQAKISVSNELTEEIIEALLQEKAPIDSWGVGTKMVTGGGDSSFTGVYKLCAKYSKKSGKMIATMKFSDNPEKTTNPGVKDVWRLYDEQGMAKADILSLQGEEVVAGKLQSFYHPMVDYRQFSFTPSAVKSLLHQVLSGGKLVEPRLNESEILLKAKKHLCSEFDKLDNSYKRILNPHIYKVSITQQLKDLKVSFIKQNLHRQ